MPKFKVECRFIFSGTFEVTAENKTDAHELVHNDCGLVMGENIHSTLDDKDINWDFYTHPEKK